MFVFTLGRDPAVGSFFESSLSCSPVSPQEVLETEEWEPFGSTTRLITTQLQSMITTLDEQTVVRRPLPKGSLLQLPNELLAEIFTWIPNPHDYFALFMTDKRLQHVACTPTLWPRALLKEYGRDVLVLPDAESLVYQTYPWAKTNYKVDRNLMYLVSQGVRLLDGPIDQGHLPLSFLKSLDCHYPYFMSFLLHGTPILSLLQGNPEWAHQVVTRASHQGQFNVVRSLHQAYKLPLCYDWKSIHVLVCYSAAQNHVNTLSYWLSVIPSDTLFPHFQCALELSAVHGALDTLKILHQHGAAISTHAFTGACEKGHSRVVEYLLEQGHIDHRTNNEQALLSAAKSGFTQVVRVLVERGASPRAMGESLVMAVEQGHLDVIKTLFYYSYPLTYSPSSKKALFYACDTGNSDVLDVLLECGVSVQSNMGAKAFLAAVQQGHAVIVKKLLKHGATVHQTTCYKALVHVCKNGHEEIADSLLSSLAVNVYHQQDEALITAVQHGRHSVVKLLIENGAHVTARRNSALVIAASLPDIQLMTLLIEQGAKDQDLVALETALKKGHLTAARVLVFKEAVSLSDKMCRLFMKYQCMNSLVEWIPLKWGWKRVHRLLKPSDIVSYCSNMASTCRVSSACLTCK